MFFLKILNQIFSQNVSKWVAACYMEIGGRVQFNEMRDLFVGAFDKDTPESELSELERQTGAPVHFHVHLRYNGKMKQLIGGLIEQVLVSLLI